MASVAVRCGGGGVASSGGRNLRAASSRNATLAMVIGGGSRKEMRTPISMSVSVSLSSSSTSADVSRANRLETRRRKKGRQEEAVSHENVIDQWMRDSVVEIVKNLREAPLLVHVYSDGDGNGDASSKTLSTGKAAPEDWIAMKAEWESGTAPKPEGVIFVEQLRDEEEEHQRERDGSETSSTGMEGASGITRAWGVVVQGRGQNCGPACYLLKTSRVGSDSGSGIGLCCTHFCLVKVKSFRETAASQLKNCWLLNGS